MIQFVQKAETVKWHGIIRFSFQLFNTNDFTSSLHSLEDNYRTSQTSQFPYCNDVTEGLLWAEGPDHWKVGCLKNHLISMALCQASSIKVKQLDMSLDFRLKFIDKVVKVKFGAATHVQVRKFTLASYYTYFRLIHMTYYWIFKCIIIYFSINLRFISTQLLMGPTMIAT